MDAVTTSSMSRRWFLIATASGIATGMTSGSAGARVPVERSLGEGYQPTVWYTIADDGKITVHIHMVEMGQHVGTALARIVAEELEADWDDVTFVHVDTDPKWGYMVTGGSWSVNHNFFAFSRAGAAGRIALIESGARAMGVAPADCVARDSHVIAGARSMSYADIVSRGLVERQFSKDALEQIELKPASERRLLNKDTKARDIPAKVDGSATYGIDRTVDGMVYARPVMPPVRFGCVVVDVQDQAAREKVPCYLNHVVIDDPTGTAQGWVLAIGETWFAASRAAELMKVTWEGGQGQHVSEADLIAEGERVVEDESLGSIFMREGEPGEVLSTAETVHQGLYTTNTVLHMQLEPVNAIAWRDGDVWRFHGGNQWQSLTLPLVAKALGVDPSKVVFETSYLGGGFGRRLYCDFFVPAALAAKALDRPVKLVLARGDDAEFDCPRSPTVHRVRSVTGEDGALRAYDHACAAGWSTAPIAPNFLAEGVDGGKIDPFSINGADHWYAAETMRVRTINNELVQKTFLPGNLRSVSSGYTHWAVETHIDEVAHALGRDPAAYRIALLDAQGRNAGSAPHAVGGAARLRAVLERVVEMSGWRDRDDLPKDVGMGVSGAFGQERGMPTWIGTVAQVKVDRKTGELDVQKIWAAVDAGTLAHPDGALAQMEGAILWGVSMAVHEGTLIESGLPRDRNFDTYTPLRMHQVPALEIDFVINDHMPVGLGEPGVVGTGPAIGNAVFHAIGKRLRALPMRPADILAALEA
ncbi:MAG: molybdopterin-dependent oxidoreductase [Alphaproteobacteria bacterium]